MPRPERVGRHHDRDGSRPAAAGLTAAAALAPDRPTPDATVKYTTTSTAAGITVLGSTPDGRRAVVVSMNTALGDSPEHILAQQHAADALIDRELCRS